MPIVKARRNVGGFIFTVIINLRSHLSQEDNSYGIPNRGGP